MDLKFSCDYMVRLRKEITVSNSQYEVGVSLLSTPAHGRTMNIVVLLLSLDSASESYLTQEARKTPATNQFPSVKVINQHPSNERRI